jgi:hypothetical protein
MIVLVSSVDYNPPELNEQVPFRFTLLRMLPGPDRPDYWLGSLDTPIRWLDDDRERFVEHLVVCARWAGTEIGPGFQNLPIGIAYVTDPTQLDDADMRFDKCRYVAIGVASVIGGSATPPKPKDIIGGQIAALSDLGKLANVSFPPKVAVATTDHCRPLREVAEFLGCTCSYHYPSAYWLLPYCF